MERYKKEFVVNKSLKESMYDQTIQSLNSLRRYSLHDLEIGLRSLSLQELKNLNTGLDALHFNLEIK